MAHALTHKIAPEDLVVPGIVLDGMAITPRELQEMTTKFWGVNGESRIFGDTGGRTLDIPVLIYDEDELDPKFTTKQELSEYLDETLNQDHIGATAALTIHSQSQHGDFSECTFDGLILLPGGIKIDHAGSLGGGPFAICRFIFRQHT